MRRDAKEDKREEEEEEEEEESLVYSFLQHDKRHEVLNARTPLFYPHPHPQHQLPSTSFFSPLSATETSESSRTSNFISSNSTYAVPGTPSANQSGWKTTAVADHLTHRKWLFVVLYFTFFFVINLLYFFSFYQFSNDTSSTSSSGSSGSFSTSASSSSTSSDGSESSSYYYLYSSGSSSSSSSSSSVSSGSSSSSSNFLEAHDSRFYNIFQKCSMIGGIYFWMLVSGGGTRSKHVFCVCLAALFAFSLIVTLFPYDVRLSYSQNVTLSVLVGFFSSGVVVVQNLVGWATYPTNAPFWFSILAAIREISTWSLLAIDQAFSEAIESISPYLIPGSISATLVAFCIICCIFRLDVKEFRQLDNIHFRNCLIRSSNSPLQPSLCLLYFISFLQSCANGWTSLVVRAFLLGNSPSSLTHYLVYLIPVGFIFIVSGMGSRLAVLKLKGSGWKKLILLGCFLSFVGCLVNIGLVYLQVLMPSSSSGGSTSSSYEWYDDWDSPRTLSGFLFGLGYTFLGSGGALILTSLFCLSHLILPGEKLAWVNCNFFFTWIFASLFPNVVPRLFDDLLVSDTRSTTIFLSLIGGIFVLIALASLKIKDTPSLSSSRSSSSAPSSTVYASSSAAPVIPSFNPVYPHPHASPSTALYPSPSVSSTYPSNLYPQT